MLIMDAVFLNTTFVNPTLDRILFCYFFSVADENINNNSSKHSYDLSFNNNVELRQCFTLAKAIRNKCKHILQNEVYNWYICSSIPFPSMQAHYTDKPWTWSSVILQMDLFKMFQYNTFLQFCQKSNLSEILILNI